MNVNFLSNAIFGRGSGKCIFLVRRLENARFWYWGLKNAIF